MIAKVNVHVVLKTKEKVIVDNRRVKELESQFEILIEENHKMKITLEDWRNKLINFEQQILQFNHSKSTLLNEKTYLEAEIQK